MKKVLTVLLVLVLAVSAVSAAKVKVGAELGYGIDILKASGKMDEMKGSYTYLNNGITANLTGEYDLNEELGVKLSAGVMYGFKAKIIEKLGSDKEITTCPKNSGIYFDVLLDAKYSFNFSKQFAVAGLGGVEMVYGHFTKSGDKEADKETKNLAFGVNAGVEVSYMVIDNLYINGGVSVSWLFVNTNKILNEMKKAAKESGGKISINSFYIRPYVGATYAF